MTTPRNLPVLAVLASTGVFVILAAMALRGDDPWTVLFVPAYLVLIAGGWRVARRTGDLLNPMTLLILFGLIRFGLPGMLMLAGAQPHLPLYDLMALSPGDWQRGHGLAMGGLLATLGGWLLGPRRAHGPGMLASPPSPKLCWLGWMVGIASLIIFVQANFPSFAFALVSGAFRRAEIQEGTGLFFYLGLLAIPSSIYIGGMIVSKRGAFVAAIIPVLTTLVLFVLGGRARSLVPIAALFLLIWYRRGHRRPSPVRALGQAILLTGALSVGSWIVYAGAMYRGGQLASISTAGWWSYLQRAIFVDIGHLGPLAAASKLGGGSMGAESFLASLLWPFSSSLGLQGRSAGVFMLETLVGREYGWGLLPSLVGDAFLSVGVGGALAISFLFGAWVKALYRAFCDRSVPAAVYVLLATYSMRLYFETIGRMYELYVVMGYVVSFVLLGWIQSRRVRLQPAARSAGDAVG